MINHVYGLAVRVILTDQEDKILILKRSTDSKTNPANGNFLVEKSIRMNRSTMH